MGSSVPRALFLALWCLPGLGCVVDCDLNPCWLFDFSSRLESLMWFEGYVHVADSVF